MLVDLVDLALIGKQAHWNVDAAQFRSVHLFLDELVDSWRDFADQVADAPSASEQRPTARPRPSPAQASWISSPRVL
jgi:starvation-inducible DNA-binding protein